MHALFLPPVMLMLCAAIMLALYYLAPLATLIPSPWHWGGLLPMAAGVCIANWHARLFRRIGTNINTFGEPGTLTTEGLFSRTRNPMYLGMLLAIAGLAWLLGNAASIGPVLLFFLLAQCWYIPLEERNMQRKFGVEFSAYQERVPRWFRL